LSLGHPSPEVERAILSGDRPHRRRSAPTIGVGVDGIRTAAETVGFRDAVSQQVVMILQRIRDDPAVTGGLGVTAGLALRRLAQVAAAGAGRTDVEMEDIDLLLAPVLEHRLVVREGETPRQVLARATAEVV
jgi:MoxR-like ATPase